MIKIDTSADLHLAADGEKPIAISEIATLLRRVSEHGSIASAALAVGLSYRHAWGMLRAVELRLGGALIDKSRGRGSTLTVLGERLIGADTLRTERLGAAMRVLASEVQYDLGRALAAANGTPRMQASHGFAVAALADAMQARGARLDLSYRESIAAVGALSRGACELAGFHLPIGEFRGACALAYRPLLDDQRHVLIRLTRRRQGLFLRSGNPAGVTGLRDLARTDIRFVNRQPGSGTRVLLDMALRQVGVDPEHINGYSSAELTHSAIAAFVASDMADIGFGVEPAARRFGLDFVPIVDEDYYFACEKQRHEAGALAGILDVLASASFRAEVNRLAGYDATGCGELVEVAHGLAG